MATDETFDTTCTNETMDSTQNSTVVDTTRDSNSSSIPPCSAVDEISSMYKQQVLASSAQLEAKYQAVMKETNKKFRTERTQKKQLEKELTEAKALIETTRALERELKANSLVLQAVKKELDLSNRSLEKSIVSEKQREQDFIRVRGECDDLEKTNFNLGRNLQEKANALAITEEELEKNIATVNQLAKALRSTEKEFEERENSLRQHMQAQFTEMQEDMAILVGRMQEMSAIKQKYETTEKNFETAVEENKILVATVAEMKNSLCSEIAKCEALRENVTQLGRENSSYVKQIEALENEKWTKTAALEKSQTQLKEIRVEQLDLKKTLGKKEKVLLAMGNSLSKVEGELKSMEKMYKSKLEENTGLKRRVEDFEKLQSDVDQKEREMKAMDTQIDRLERDNSELNANLEMSEKKLSAEIAILRTEKECAEKQLKSISNEHESSEVNVCELRIKIQQLTDEQVTFQAARRQFENELAEQASKREQAEHNAKRLQRKQDFLQDELDQFKSQFDKERSKFEQATRDNINLQDQVASLRTQLDTVTLQLHDAEHRNNKTMCKSDRMKEKVKAYQKNVADAHGEEIDQLMGTIDDLKKRLTDKEQQFRGRGESTEVEKQKKRESHRISELECTISEIRNKVFHLESENKTLETMLDSKKRRREENVSPKVSRRKSKAATEHPALAKVLEDDSQTVISEAGEENKENAKPRSKSKSKNPDAKKARVVLAEKQNDTTLAPRATRNRKPSHNKTMF